MINKIYRCFTWFLLSGLHIHKTWFNPMVSRIAKWLIFHDRGHSIETEYFSNGAGFICFKNQSLKSISIKRRSWISEWISWCFGKLVTPSWLGNLLRIFLLRKYGPPKRSAAMLIRSPGLESRFKPTNIPACLGDVRLEDAVVETKKGHYMILYRFEYVWINCHCVRIFFFLFFEVFFFFFF